MHAPIKAFSVLSFSEYFHPLPFRPSISQLFQSILRFNPGSGHAGAGGGEGILLRDAYRWSADTALKHFISCHVLRNVYGSQPEGVGLCSEPLYCGVDQVEADMIRLVMLSFNRDN